MLLAELPTHLLVSVAEILDSEPAINALARTSRKLYAQLSPFLYRYHVQRHIHSPAPALIWAVEHGYSDTMLKLLKAGVNLNCARFWDSRRGKATLQHPLVAAAKKGHLQLVRLLLDEKGVCDRLTASDYNTALRMAAILGHMDVVDLLLERDVVDPWYTREGLRRYSNDGQSTLCWVISEGGTPEVVQRLLTDMERQGLDATTKSTELGHALCLAAEYGGDNNAQNIATQLLAAGADVNFQERVQNNTPLSLSASFKHVSLARLLLQAGADPNQTRKGGWGPLAYATYAHRGLWRPPPTDWSRRNSMYPSTTHRSRAPLPPLSPDMKDAMMTLLDLLFEHGADPTGDGGGLALYHALIAEHYPCARFLLERGARLRAASIAGSLDPSKQALVDQALADGNFAAVTQLLVEIRGRCL